MTVDIDGIKLDISKFSKKIIFEHKNGKILVTYSLDFPPFTDNREFETELEAKEFINEIKKEGDKVKYK